MGQPSSLALPVRGFVRNAAIRYQNRMYIQSGASPVGGRAFPILPNVTRKSKILTYPKGAWFRNEAGKMGAAGGRAPRGGYPTGTVNIDPEGIWFAKEVTGIQRSLAAQSGAPPLRLDQNAMIFTADKIDLWKEKKCADVVIATDWSGIGAGGEDAGGFWAASGSNTFIIDIFKRIETIWSATGFRPNSLIIDQGTWLSLQQEATLTARLKTTTDKIVTSQLLKSLFDLEHIHIGGAIISTDGEKKDGTDFTKAAIWELNTGKGMGFLYYVPPAASLDMPSALYECQERFGESDGGQLRRTRTWKEPAENNQDVYESAEQVDFVPSAADLGFMWNDTLLT